MSLQLLCRIHRVSGSTSPCGEKPGTMVLVKVSCGIDWGFQSAFLKKLREMKWIKRMRQTKLSEYNSFVPLSANATYFSRQFGSHIIISFSFLQLLSFTLLH